MSNSNIISDTLDNSKCWQIRQILTIYLLKITTAFFMACIVYTAPIPKRINIYCEAETKTNDSKLMSFQFPQVIESNDQEFDLPLCDAFAEIKKSLSHFKDPPPWVIPDNGSLVFPCEVFENRAPSLFDIFCSRGALIVLVQGMHLVGILLGGPVARISMKTFSPKTFLQIAIMTQIIAGNVAGILDYLSLHLLFRCLAAIGCSAMCTAGSVIICDITNGKFRTSALVFFDLFWSFGIMILSVITQFESRFMQLYFVISNPSILILFLTIFLTDSPIWFLKRGILEKVEEILSNASSSFGSKAKKQENLMVELKLLHAQRQTLEPQENFIKMVKNVPKLPKLICFYISWACFTIMYFGMVLNMRNYGKYSLFKNALFLAGFEIFGCIFAVILCLKVPMKKWFFAGFFNVFGAILALCIWFFKEKESNFVIDGTLLYFCLILKSSVSTSFGILTVSTSNIVSPTQTEITSFTGVLFGRICLLIAPVIVALGTPFGEFLSLTIFASLGAIGGISFITIGFLQDNEDDKKDKLQC